MRYLQGRASAEHSQPPDPAVQLTFLLPALLKLAHAPPYSKSTNDDHDEIAEACAAALDTFPPDEP